NGGEIPGIIAAPALRELVRQARTYALRLERAIEVYDEGGTVTAWVEAEPDSRTQGCTVRVTDWRPSPAPVQDGRDAGARRAAIERHVAELTARLGPGQEVIAVDC